MISCFSLGCLSFTSTGQSASREKKLLLLLLEQSHCTELGKGAEVVNDAVKERSHNLVASLRQVAPWVGLSDHRFCSFAVLDVGDARNT